VSVIAVLREDQPHPAPGREFRMEAGEALVVVDTPDGIGAAEALLPPG
jgi:TrkA domain protein